MPFIHATLGSTDLPESTLIEIRDGLARLIAAHLRKKIAVTSVLVETRASAGPVSTWGIGMESPAEGRTPAHVTALITAGTNSAAEKAAFIAAVMNLLRVVLGRGVDETSYVVVQEVPATDWGYGGLTQADRAGQKTSVDPG